MERASQHRHRHTRINNTCRPSWGLLIHTRINNTCRLSWGSLKTRNTRLHSWGRNPTLFTPTGPLQQSKPNTFLISEFPDPLSSRPFTWERLHEGQGSRICGMTRIYSFSSMTHPRPPEIWWLRWRIWELFLAHMRACSILSGGPYIFWGLAAWVWSLCFIHFYSCY